MRSRGVGGGETRWVVACACSIVVRMVGLGEVQAQVSVSYDRLGMPSWPNPHPQKTSPREEEYSRVSEPDRYRIVHARAQVWAGELGAVPGLAVEPLAPAPLDEGGHLGWFDRGVRLASPRPGTLPLLLLERDVRLPELDASLAVLHISVVEPQIAVAMVPDCGCDACDWGSLDLLRAVDRTIGTVVGGPFAALRGEGWHAQWHSDGGSAGGTGPCPDHADLIELCRSLARGQDVRLPDGAEAFAGGPWFPELVLGDPLGSTGAGAWTPPWIEWPMSSRTRTPSPRRAGRPRKAGTVRTRPSLGRRSRARTTALPEQGDRAPEVQGTEITAAEAEFGV